MTREEIKTVRYTIALTCWGPQSDEAQPPATAQVWARVDPPAIVSYGSSQATRTIFDKDSWHEVGIARNIAETGIHCPAPRHAMPRE